MDKRKTHRGTELDIDLIRMKHELEQKEINSINIKREKEIDGKRRRGNSTKINEMLANQEAVKQKLREQKAKKPEEIVEDHADEEIAQLEAETPTNAILDEVAYYKEEPEITGAGRRIAKK